MPSGVYMSANNIIWIEMNLNPKIPPNTECTMIIENVSSDKALHAGVRTKGSSLNRRRIILPKTSIQMKVKTDIKSKIETYSENRDKIIFRVKI